MFVMLHCTPVCVTFHCTVYRDLETCRTSSYEEADFVS